MLVHDFAGHPFQIDLSRALARRGHTVQHVYCGSYTSGKGRFEQDDVPGLSVVAIPAGESFARYSPVRRIGQEAAYGRRFTRVAALFDPDVILACNVPLVAKSVAASWCRRQAVPWVFWLQDLHSIAMMAEAEKRAGRLGRRVGTGFEVLERRLLRQADAVVSITDDFSPVLDAWGVDGSGCTVIENWAPLGDLPVRPRDNEWRIRQGFGDRFLYLYTGTLGLKHRPELLYHLARERSGDADVVVISEGMGEARLRQMLRDRPLANLHLLPFQSIADYPDILGAADVLVALLEPTAGTFSVPSKVLSYLCAGRPILAAIPPENLAARTIERAGAGLVVDATDQESFLTSAKQLRVDAALRADAGQRARAYAEATFDTAVIADRFQDVIERAVVRGAVRAADKETRA
ncbi:MAG TPA: glycosyltransferase family 4 protein [Acidimicrobiales bacterium]|nr:glycosyltransferase family 4 protein [Acidimicrobiales bacterium]